LARGGRIVRGKKKQFWGLSYSQRVVSEKLRCGTVDPYGGREIKMRVSRPEHEPRKKSQSAKEEFVRERKIKQHHGEK